MIKGCLMMPFRLAATAALLAVLYLAWVNRDEVRRWIHRATAEPGRGAVETEPPADLVARAAARLDSLAKHRADSVVLPPSEVEAVVRAEIGRRATGLADSITVRLDEGAVLVRARVDAGKLPREQLGPLADWLSGRQTVGVGGPIGLLRVGTGEWRIDQVVIRGLPVPKALWSSLLGMVVPGAKSTVTFPVDRWITGVRVGPDGVVLYGGVER